MAGSHVFHGPPKCEPRGSSRQSRCRRVLIYTFNIRPPFSPTLFSREIAIMAPNLNSAPRFRNCLALRTSWVSAHIYSSSYQDHSLTSIDGKSTSANIKPSIRQRYRDHNIWPFWHSYFYRHHLSYSWSSRT